MRKCFNFNYFHIFLILSNPKVKGITMISIYIFLQALCVEQSSALFIPLFHISQAGPLQSIVARKYLATTTLVPPQWGTLWGGALDAED